MPMEARVLQSAGLPEWKVMGLKSGKLVAGTAAILLLMALAACAAGCAPSATSVEQKDQGGAAPAPEAVAVDFIWSPDADCATCHKTESASMEDSKTTAGVHGADNEVCADCHVDDKALAVAHDKATTDSNMPKKLKKTLIDKDLCLACHGSQDELAAKTADSKILTDSEGTTCNPHALSAGPDHDSITCSDCHKMHGQEPIADTAKAECISCHHQDVYECNTCHDA